MARSLYFLLAILVFVLIVTFALLTRSCQTPVIPVCFDRRTTLEEAQTRSNDSGKPVLVLVTSDACEECAALKAGALNRGYITDWIRDHTEPVYLNVTKAASGDSEAQTTMARLDVGAPPVIVVLSKGRELGRIVGNPSAKDLHTQLEAIVKGASPP